MTFKTSFARQLADGAGIVDLMSDLGEALNVNPDLLFLGGGNPARIDAVEAILASHLHAIAEDADAIHQMLGVYQSPLGSERLRAALAAYFQSLGWPVTEANIALTNGSQSAFFMLFNLFADGVDQRQILLPWVPEYLGYQDQVLHPGVFRTMRPVIRCEGDNRFEYGCDFDALELSGVTAMCVSSPANPSGKVLSTEEYQRLGALADAAGIPLILDAAYGAPFPGIVFSGTRPAWQTNRIFVLSLSKLGLPGARTGVVVADEAVIEALGSVNTVMSLASGNLGPTLLLSLLQAGTLDILCEQHVLPFYASRRRFALDCLARHLEGIPHRVHRADGAFFLWLWLPELSVPSRVLYERLKARNVLVMDGAHFFFDQAESWSHAQQCLRLTYCAEPQVFERAIEILAQELHAISD